MASSRSYEPVLHCRKDRPNEVYRLSGRLLQGVYKNPGKFPNPPVSKVFFEAEREELRTFIITSKGNTQNKELRDLKAVDVHGYCSQLLDFVKPICKNDIELIQMTGFDHNHLPQKHQPPRQPQSVKIKKTKTLNTYKLIMGKMKTGEGVEPDPATHQRDVRYTVELTLTPDTPESWKEVCIAMPRTKLFFDKVFPGERNYVRVYGTNSAGRGGYSNNTYFTPDLP